MQRILIVLALTLAGWAAAAQAQTGGLAVFDRAGLSIETAAGGRHDFQVEVAATPDQRAQGLMFREHMAADAGMLFLFERTQVRAMWMKNTLIPLDMLFIDAGGRIVRIEERTVPHSLRAIASGRPVTAVLELNAGTAARLDIKPGDRVLHPAFD